MVWHIVALTLRELIEIDSEREIDPEEKPKKKAKRKIGLGFGSSHASPPKLTFNFGNQDKVRQRDLGDTLAFC